MCCLKSALVWGEDQSYYYCNGLITMKLQVTGAISRHREATRHSASLNSPATPAEPLEAGHHRQPGVRFDENKPCVRLSQARLGLLPATSIDAPALLQLLRTPGLCLIDGEAIQLQRRVGAGGFGQVDTSLLNAAVASAVASAVATPRIAQSPQHSLCHPPCHPTCRPPHQC